MFAQFLEEEVRNFRVVEKWIQTEDHQFGERKANFYLIKVDNYNKMGPPPPAGEEKIG